ncbi:YtxH domain-containing protein [Psychrobacillus soli]|uniref:YtxH domain-containing protein n=1 Tax=Psychrobacillus soli TaxID=1543965 RepID=A0A544TCX4_9BACI|nr:YtxH domain-containing protein [Psychrobacillus soli]TQR15275.1 YtxH domain-containing protein [Psychrobacillus soli]
MGESKFIKGVVCGALIGGALTMLDNKTRNAVLYKSKSIGRQIKYYSTNRQELITTIEDQFTKWKSFYEQINSDATYISQKVNEVKEMTPQVKTLLTDTKEAFEQSKEEYKSIVVPETDEHIVKQ